MPSVQEPSAGPRPPRLPERQLSVTALYDYTADPADPMEISFNKGDILDIIDQEGKWWCVMKQDGIVGIAPSNYLRDGRKYTYTIAATAVDDYTADKADKNEICLNKGEALEILDRQGKWWQVRKLSNGKVGYAPAQVIREKIPAKDRMTLGKSFSAEIGGIFNASLLWQMARAEESNCLGVRPDLYENTIDSDIGYNYKATARFHYNANPTDPNEVSFRKGDVMQVAHKQGRWWLVKKEDGTTGVAPSTFLEILPRPMDGDW
ncbi:hypothetical protein DFH06DRAFT_1321266 [Mycena polygramma]|nr:hypothetical protein DFH06DRAFT_1321266 [Mycena polygramma]